MPRSIASHRIGNMLGLATRLTSICSSIRTSISGTKTVANGSLLIVLVYDM